MDKYIVKMIDGGIKNIATDGWCEAKGCSTCGYGGWHVREMTLQMNGFDLIVQMGDMYDFSLPTHEDLIHWFDNNMSEIKEMNQKEFISFLKGNMEFNCDNIKFIKSEEI